MSSLGKDVRVPSTGYHSSKILDFSELRQVKSKYPNKKTVQCHGVFDVLHAGHLAYFESAKKFGDILVVTITCDSLVNKGPGRPYFTEAVRASMLAALEIVDFVSISKYPTAVQSIEALKPDFYVKGPDYRDKASDPTGGIYEEESAVQSHGGKLVFTDDVTFSSSTLINDFFKIWSDEQQQVIQKVKSLGGMSLIEETLEKISKETVRIVGEPIVDTYVFCEPESISSKSPSISARYSHEENYTGGSLAIANHLVDFVKDVRLLITHGDELYFNDLLQKKLNSAVNLIDHKLPNVPTPRKIRYITVSSLQRIFEVTDIRFDQWMHYSSDPFIQMLEKTENKNGVTLIADFGHGLFEGKVLQFLEGMNGFVGLNVQTNSSNLGFNPFTKHKRYNYLSVDTKEVRIAFHNRYDAPMELAEQIRRNNKEISCSITLGPGGACYYPERSEDKWLVPAFTDVVLDATGAGDAYFAMSALLNKVQCPPILVPFIGNVFAGLKTKILGNKFSVSKPQLIKALSSILK